MYVASERMWTPNLVIWLQIINIVCIKIRIKQMHLIQHQYINSSLNEFWITNNEKIRIYFSGYGTVNAIAITKTAWKSFMCNMNICHFCYYIMYMFICILWFIVEGRYLLLLGTFANLCRLVMLLILSQFGRVQHPGILQQFLSTREPFFPCFNSCNIYK